MKVYFSKETPMDIPVTSYVSKYGMDDGGAYAILEKRDYTEPWREKDGIQKEKKITPLERKIKRIKSVFDVKERELWRLRASAIKEVRKNYKNRNKYDKCFISQGKEEYSLLNK